MRQTCLGLLSAATFLSAASATAEEFDLPLRRAGLWDVHTQTDEGAGVRNQDLGMCIGEEMERAMVRASGAENRANCARYEVKKAADATTVDASCTYDDRKVATHTELRGDFTTAFQVKVESTTSGNAPPYTVAMGVRVNSSSPLATMRPSRIWAMNTISAPSRHTACSRRNASAEPDA